MKNRKLFSILIGLVAVVLLCGILALIPPISERIANKINDMRIRIQYALNPPEEVVFVPQEQVDTSIEETNIQDIIIPSSTPTMKPTLVKSPTPTLTPTPLAPQVTVPNMYYEDQHGLWNYCGPSNLSMMLTHWGWEGNRETIGPYLKPVEKDKNVMPYEMANYVINQTELDVLIRYGGTVETIKRLLANGYPVLIEKGVYFFETLTGREGWMGHYNVVIGYDDTTDEFIIHDTYLEDGENYHFSYDEIINQWRSFNYVFLVVYPPEDKDKVFSVLGDYANEDISSEIAANTARKEMDSLEGIDRFFAMFNLGTSMINLNDYVAATVAYDDAFTYYATLSEERRPWRIMWYQTGPYAAYYYTGRYQDVVNLASQTLDTASDPYLEESYYWRAMAEVNIGNKDDAIRDLRTSIKMHPDFPPSIELMQSLGIYE